MSLKSNFVNIQLQSSLPLNSSLPIFQIPSLQCHRVWRRPRLKRRPSNSLTLRNRFGFPSLENFAQHLISHFPNVNSLDLLAPALGFASGLALYFSGSKFNRVLNPPAPPDAGEWILFTSPTPFNRFVMLRCPSISFVGSELLEDVNEKLVKEDRHFVRLNSGRIQFKDSDDGYCKLCEQKLEYQRVCVSANDGGVISLDWPANLDLSEEHGLDTTLLIVPGTTEGSMDKKIREFVCESLKRGCFPVVMNPRGSAGSPLTTARLFTAADSDDICTALQFIKKARPWTTLMGVGWGYGANMLTKYLAEVGEKTPLTAATCIDNPFDLEEATRSLPYNMTIDRTLTRGLIDILRSNKELFQGRAKGFDVERALLATSIRDFEKAISMVSYGYDAIEDFYAKSSTQGVVGNLKIPVLFIQNDEGMAPLFSIPRSLIAENPFTSLLLCSCLPPYSNKIGRSAVIWCQNLTLEWLMAVELGLLKGRHPLLKDIDVTINPAKGLALAEGRSSNKSGRGNNLLNLPYLNELNGHPLDPLKVAIERSNAAAGIHSRSSGDLQSHSGHDNKEKGDIDADLVKEDEGISSEGERGQMQQTTKVVMNMLNATMPGILDEEQTKQVLTAIGQGETVVNALQDAVPVDVREKLTTAVSEILHKQGSNLKFDGLLKIGQTTKASGLNSKIQEKSEGLPTAEVGNQEPRTSDQMKRVDGSDNNLLGTDKPSGSLGLESQASENLQNSKDVDQFQLSSQPGIDASSSGEKRANEFVNVNGSDDFTGGIAPQSSENKENGQETSSNGDSPSQSELAYGNEGTISDQYKVEQSGSATPSSMKEDTTLQHAEETNDSSSTDQNVVTSSTKMEERLSQPASSSDTQLEEIEASEKQKKEEKTVNPVNQVTSSGPTFNVSQALDALTGLDDSTQVAVNSVFHVIEDMITQLEERDNENNVKASKKDEDQKAGFSSNGYETVNVDELYKNEDDKKDSCLLPEDTIDVSSYKRVTANHDLGDVMLEKRSSTKPISSGGTKFENNQKNKMGSLKDEKNEKGEVVMQSKFSVKKSNNLRHLNNISYHIPLYITTQPYADPLYMEYIRKYLLSKVENTESLDLDTTTALFLDYIPEEGQWQLLDSVGDTESPKGLDHKTLKTEFSDEIIEPSYVILESGQREETVGNGDENLEGSIQFVKKIILDSLKVEVERKLSAVDVDVVEPNLAADMKYVADTVSLEIGHCKENEFFLEGEDPSLGKVGMLHGERIITAISSAVQETSHLRKLLPVGVIVGSSLAALRKFFKVTAANDSDDAEEATLDEASKSGGKSHFREGDMDTDKRSYGNMVLKNGPGNSICGEKTDSESRGNAVMAGAVLAAPEASALQNSSDNSVMVGAVTAALGASALLVHQKDSCQGRESAGISSESLKGAEKLEEMSYKSQNNLVTSLAEKAMSVAGPVVPTKEDGGVDHEKLVAMLAELGQKGGILRLVGKIALLWGGIRGAMSLTDRLISFLRLAERPLIQRILGFVCMTLVLWSPVVVPLFPTLVNGWATHNPSRIAELACIIGLYASVTILVVLWGKRIRGYQNPLEEYGLDLTSLPKIQNFLTGLIGGIILVLLIQSVNAVLGCVHLSWLSTLPSRSSNVMALLGEYGRVVILIFQALVTATGVAIVEELLFRSWLPDEVAADFGYHRGIIISGFAFSLSQKSPSAMPGLWLLSLSLAGARQRSEGSLSLPIGLRAGILASSFILQMGGFLTSQPNIPLWLTGTHPFQPFSGIVGLAFSLLLATLLYPREPPRMKKIPVSIRE